MESMQKTCINCNAPFEIIQDDLVFLDKVSPVINERKYSLPPPINCPDCRYQRRMAMRNERKLHQRTCDMTGEEMISLYTPDTPYTVYKEEVWWSDDWDPMDYGEEIKFGRSFFEQFSELRLAVPRRSMQHNGIGENCDYTAYGNGNRSCYLSSACQFCEDMYYSPWMVMSKSCADCMSCFQSELLYECIDCMYCYQCFYSYDSSNCQDCYYLESCRNCHHCIACKNLRNKGYHIYNEPVSKEEYENHKQALHQGNFEQERNKFDEWKVTIPTLFAHIFHSENCTGNSLENANNCINCFDILLGAQDLRNCQYGGWKGKDMMDCSMAGAGTELLYEVMAAANAQQCAFCLSLQTSSDCYYCEGLKQCQYCFGCIGLSHKKFCIFNTQYSQEEYFKLVHELITMMQQNNEWGENVPIKHSPFPYNDTLAQESWPLTKQQALTKGYQWRDEVEKPLDVEKIIPGRRLPSSIKDVPDDVLNWAIACEVTGKPFRIIQQELLFYRCQDIPLPRIHPDERHMQRHRSRNPHMLWKRECMKCGDGIETAYAPDRLDIVYCESCYLDEAYHVQDSDSHKLNKQALHKTQMLSKGIARKARSAKLLLQAKANEYDKV